MKLDQLDHIDTTILSELATNARSSQVDLAKRCLVIAATADGDPEAPHVAASLIGNDSRPC